MSPEQSHTMKITVFGSQVKFQIFVWHQLIEKKKSPYKKFKKSVSYQKKDGHVLCDVFWCDTIHVKFQ